MLYIEYFDMFLYRLELLKSYSAGDQQNRIMGYAVIRQIRIRPNTCRVHPSFHSMTRVCAQQTNMVNEDDRDYCDGWTEMNNMTENLPSCQREVST